MYGKGIVKGLSVTLKRFVDTYLDDIAWWGRRYFKPEGIAHRSSKDGRGIFTVQYPEEKLPGSRGISLRPVPGLRRASRRSEGNSLHVVRHLRQGLPAAVHLDRPHE